MNLPNNPPFQIQPQIEAVQGFSQHPVREFDLKSFKITYENRAEVKEVADSNESREVVIRNFICKKIDNQLKKKTEILIGHRLIILEDNYIFSDRSFLPENSSKSCIESETNASTSSPKNKDDESDMGGLDQCKRDRKNVVKNIIKAFESWLRVISEQEGNPEYTNSRKLLNRMITKVKFNNQLINEILANANLNSSFEEFLDTEATNWLNSSKIRDRLSHQETIDLYRRSCSSGKLEKPKNGL